MAKLAVRSYTTNTSLFIGGRLAGTIVRGEMGRDAMTGVVCRSSLHTCYLI